MGLTPQGPARTLVRRGRVHIPRGSCSACCSRRSAGRPRWPWPAPCAASAPTASSGVCSGTPATAASRHRGAEPRLCAQAGGWRASKLAPPRHAPTRPVSGPQPLRRRAAGPTRMGTPAPGTPAAPGPSHQCRVRAGHALWVKLLTAGRGSPRERPAGLKEVPADGTWWLWVPTSWPPEGSSRSARQSP